MELHAIASKCITKTKQFGIDGVPSQTIFALTTLEHGPDFWQQAEWVELMHKIVSKEISFEDATRQR